MEQLLVQLAANIPAAVALLVAIKMFIDDRREDRKTWENHLTESVAAQTRNAELLERLIVLVERRLP